MPFVALETTAGQVALDVAQVCFVSAPFVKDGHAPSRRIGMNSGLVFFVIDNASNYDTLRPVLPASWGDFSPYVAPDVPVKVKAPRKARKADRWAGQKPSTTTEGPFVDERAVAREVRARGEKQENP